MNLHEKMMSKCLKLAAKAGSNTLPNPLVGAIIVKSGKIIGRGFHKKFGFPHAEAEAINNASESVENSDLYVNLEPCSHYGKTPPCAELIIKSKIKNVFIGIKDPNPKVSGRGIKKLIENGINVTSGILEEKCKEINEAFIKLITEKKSFITLKIAATLDGKTAEHTGFSKWITNEESRKYVHKLRFFSDAVMVGGNTIRNDNPLLNVRKNNKILKEPLKIIVSKSLNFSTNLNIFKNKDSIVFLTSEKNKGENKFQDIKKIFVPETENGILDLSVIDKIFYEKGIYNIFAEGGSMLNSNLLKFGKVDKLYVFFANKILGGNNSVPMFRGSHLFSLSEPYKLYIKKIKRFGQDIMIKAYPKNG